jgi:hypothetical protein
MATKNLKDDMEASSLTPQYQDLNVKQNITILIWEILTKFHEFLKLVKFSWNPVKTLDRKWW